MFKILIKITFFAIVLTNISCTNTKKVVSQTQFMLGDVSKNNFKETPYKEWFNNEYSSYKIDKNSLDLIKDKVKDNEILIYFGSWCSDSRREVPRFIKILDYLDMDYNKIHFTALDRAKKAPKYTENIWNIVYVPTFIVLTKGKEIGRIIETPSKSLELDLVEILK